MEFRDRSGGPERDKSEADDSPEKKRAAAQGFLDKYAREVNGDEVATLGNPEDRKVPDFMESLQAAGIVGAIIRKYAGESRELGEGDKGRMSLDVKTPPRASHPHWYWDPHARQESEIKYLGFVHVDQAHGNVPSKVAQATHYSLKQYRGDLGMVTAQIIYSSDKGFVVGERYVGLQEARDLSALFRECMQ